MPSGAVIKQSEVDVLIVGAGPAGLMACNALAKSRVNVRIVDRRRVYIYPEMRFRARTYCINRPAKVAAGQADGLQPRTLEVLQVYSYILVTHDLPTHCDQSYGLAERLLRDANQMHMAVSVKLQHCYIAFNWASVSMIENPRHSIILILERVGSR